MVLFVAAAARALRGGKHIRSHLNEFSSAKLNCRFYRILVFDP
jgi:hypothetical protein